MISGYMTDEQRSQTGWIGGPKWGVILGRALSSDVRSEGGLLDKVRIERLF